MKPGDRIQIRQYDGGEHWLYALVLQVSAEGILVRVTHPGNTLNGEKLLVAEVECRTKDDVAKLLKQAKAVKNAGHVTAMAKTDGFLHMIPWEDNTPARLAQHYQAQLDRLS